MKAEHITCHARIVSTPTDSRPCLPLLTNRANPRPS
jgi:hypothetical protein